MSEQTREYIAGSINYLRDLIEADDEKAFPLYDSFMDRRSHQEHFDRLNVAFDCIKVLKLNQDMLSKRLDFLEKLLETRLNELKSKKK